MDCFTKESTLIDSCALKKIMKILNASIFSFIILNLANKGILHFHVTTATDVYMKEVIDSCLRRAL